MEAEPYEIDRREVSESRLYVWRALVALAYVDGPLSVQERSFIERSIEELNFSPAQRAILEEDMRAPQDVGALFERITDKNDRSEFLSVARRLVWTDGDYNQTEREVLLALQSDHIRLTNVDDMIGDVQEYEVEDLRHVVPPSEVGRPFSFRELYIKRRFGSK